jgi:hypothetical protein
MRHAELLSAHEGETYGVREMRKHMAWYMRGFPAGGEIRRQLSQITDLESLRAVLDPMWDSDARAVDADGAPRSPGLAREGRPAGRLAGRPRGPDQCVPEDPDADGAATNGG